MSGPLKISEMNVTPLAVNSMLIPAVNSAGDNITLRAKSIADLYIPHLTKADVGLANVDNTADVDKPISNATALALSNKADTLHTHLSGHVDDFEPAVEAIIDSYASVVFDAANSNW
jgi:hypothetical protein